jgi:hypothetical protein
VLSVILCRVGVFKSASDPCLGSRLARLAPAGLGGYRLCDSSTSFEARPANFIQAVAVGGYLLLWAVDQVLPPGRIAMLIGDLVVSAYVLDLYWLIQEQEAAPVCDRRQ